MSEHTLSKKHLKWQCRRGMLELDVLLNRYLEQEFDTLTEQEKEKLSLLLSMEDPTLYEWLLQLRTSPAQFKDLINDIVTRKE